MYWKLNNNTLSLTDEITDYPKNNYSDNAEEINDLITLIHLHQPALLNVLMQRYNNNIIYTNINHILLAVNPFKKINYNIKQPCPEKIAETCLKINRNHTVLINGESGAGKTETSKILLNYITKNNKDNELGNKIIATNIILESFGNSKTIRNHNSSRFGKFIQIFYNNNKINGSKIKTYLLETIRITHHSDYERNFHIFYYLFENYNDFNYLKHNAKKDNYLKDNINFEELKNAFLNINIDSELSNKIFNTVKIIAYFGNYNEYKNEISNYFNISTDHLDQLFRKQKIKIGNEIIYKDLDENETKIKIDSFSRNLYKKLFDFIVSKINQYLTYDSYDKNVNILDIFGFEVFETNSLEQLCINYTNETLQNLFNEYIFNKEQKLYQDEGLDCEQISFNNNDKILQIIHNQNDSIFYYINEVSSFIKSNDKQIVDKIYKLDSNFINCSNLQKAKNKFSVKHYAGEVEYSVNDFISKNKNIISDDLIDFINNQQLFFISNIQKNKKKIVQNFQKELLKLRKFIETTDLHFIRCIKPNDQNIPNSFCIQRVLEQLKYNGVIEAVRVARSGYPIRFNHQEFIDIYHFIDYLDLIVTGKTKYFLTKENFNILELRKINKINDLTILIQKNYRCYINFKKYKITKIKCIKIQSVIRSYLSKKILLKLKKIKSQLIIKNWWLMIKQRLTYLNIIHELKIKKAKNNLLTFYYRWKFKKYFNYINSKATIIQSLFLISKAKKIKKQLKQEKRSIQYIQKQNEILIKQQQLENEKKIKEMKEKEEEFLRLQNKRKEDLLKIKQQEELLEKIKKDNEEKIKKQLEDQQKIINDKKLLEEKLRLEKELLLKKEKELNDITELKKRQDQTKIDVIINLTRQLEEMGKENSRLKSSYLENHDEKCIVM